MKLYTNIPAPINPRKVHIVMHEKGIKDVELVNVDRFGAKLHKTDDYTQKNRLQQIPILELNDGTVIAESIAICRYLDEKYPTPPMFGSNAVERAHVEQWDQSVQFNIWNPIGAAWRHMSEAGKQRFGADAQNVPFGNEQKAMALSRFKWLDEVLSDGRKFLACDRFSMPDVLMVTSFEFGKHSDTTVSSDLKHLSAYAERILSRPSVKETFGK
jgi:glutathione S-transferase